MRDPNRPGPVVIELNDQDAPSPAEAPPVPDTQTPQGAAMQQMVQIAARPPSKLAKWFWSILGALISFVVSIAAWDFVVNLLARNPVLGGIAFGLTALFVLILLVIALREWLAFARLRRLDHIQHATSAALSSHDLAAARKVTKEVTELYKNRPELSWGLSRLADQQNEVLDADGLLGLVEHELLAPLDAVARKEIESAARQVATVTAIVPLALADVVAALTANIRMVRRIADIYGGRAGTLGSWRLMRTVIGHLVATGAVAVGDDLIGSIAGGGVLSKVSRRFGEGVINGALTARVGVAALEVCRPMAFTACKKPSVTSIIQKALTGLFG
ncbi:MAG: TIGR01620 family protein [Pseudoruegeria sp.]